MSFLLPSSIYNYFYGSSQEQKSEPVSTSLVPEPTVDSNSSSSSSSSSSSHSSSQMVSTLSVTIEPALPVEDAKQTDNINASDQTLQQTKPDSPIKSLSPTAEEIKLFHKRTHTDVSTDTSEDNAVVSGIETPTCIQIESVPNSPSPPIIHIQDQDK